MEPLLRHHLELPCWSIGSTECIWMRQTASKIDVVCYATTKSRPVFEMEIKHMDILGPGSYNCKLKLIEMLYVAPHSSKSFNPDLSLGWLVQRWGPDPHIWSIWSWNWWTRLDTHLEQRRGRKGLRKEYFLRGISKWFKMGLRDFVLITCFL